MNVSRTADAEFMGLLETEDPKRYENLMRNIRKDSPDVRMSEEQALTNFHLGLPTGQHRFVIVAGKESIKTPARIHADSLLQDGTTEDYVRALLKFVNEPEIVPPVSKAVRQMPLRKKRVDAKFTTPAQKQRAYRERQSSTIQ